MCNEQNQNQAVTASRTESLSAPKSEMNVSNSTVIELSRDEMEHVSGGMKVILREDIEN